MKKILIPFLMILALWSLASAAGKRTYGWATYDDTKWTISFPGGNIPGDSLPDALTHVGLFAASGAVPPQSYYVSQYGPMARKLHSKGTAAGITVGGSGDAALVTMVAGGPASWTSWIRSYLPYLDRDTLDFFEFDFEGSYSTANVTGFFSQLYDSLQRRKSGIDRARAPYIVLCVDVPHAISWSAAAIQSKIEFVNLMTYDYNNGAWGRVTFDNSPKSYKNYNGTGGATDSVGTGVNAIAPSMQRMAIRVNAAGWPMNKINVGIDFNGGPWLGATMIRQSLAGVSDGGSDEHFGSYWATIAGLPASSVHFDQIARAYWATVGTKLWTWIALPGRDSGIIATRQVVDSMGLGGVCIWNLGGEVADVSPLPPGGRFWHFAMIDRYLNFRDGIIPPPPPPPPPPGDTGKVCDTVWVSRVAYDTTIASRTVRDTTVVSRIWQDPVVTCPQDPPPGPTTKTVKLSFVQGPTGSYSLLASVTTGSQDVKVLFYDNGNLKTTENIAPYYLFGDANNLPLWGTLGAGTHVVIANLYAQAGTAVIGRDTLALSAGAPVKPSAGEPIRSAVAGASAVPAEFAVGQNNPNPFNPTTSFTIALPGPSNVRAEIYNILGQKVDVLVDGDVYLAGTWTLQWDGSKYASGTYILRVVTDFGTISKTMNLIK